MEQQSVTPEQSAKKPTQDPSSSPKPAGPTLDAQEGGNNVYRKKRASAGGAGGNGEEPSSNPYLPQSVQRKMEHAFEEDFSGVNIYRDSEKANNQEALAYTQGNDIHFAPGEFNPYSRAGQDLLSHELAHVTQQRKGTGTDATQQLEQEADSAASKATNGQKAGINRSARPGTIQKKGKPRIELTAGVGDNMPNQVADVKAVAFYLGEIGYFKADRTYHKNLNNWKKIHGHFGVGIQEKYLWDLFDAIQKYQEVRMAKELNEGIIQRGVIRLNGPTQEKIAKDEKRGKSLSPKKGSPVVNKNSLTKLKEFRPKLYLSTPYTSTRGIKGLMHGVGEGHINFAGDLIRVLARLEYLGYFKDGDDIFSKLNKIGKTHGYDYSINEIPEGNAWITPAFQAIRQFNMVRHATPDPTIQPESPSEFVLVYDEVNAISLDHILMIYTNKYFEKPVDYEDDFWYPYMAKLKQHAVEDPKPNYPKYYSRIKHADLLFKEALKGTLQLQGRIGEGEANENKDLYTLGETLYTLGYIPLKTWSKIIPSYQNMDDDQVQTILQALKKYQTLRMRIPEEEAGMITNWSSTSKQLVIDKDTKDKSVLTYAEVNRFYQVPAEMREDFQNSVDETQVVDQSIIQSALKDQIFYLNAGIGADWQKFKNQPDDLIRLINSLNKLGYFSNAATLKNQLEDPRYRNFGQTQINWITTQIVPTIKQYQRERFQDLDEPYGTISPGGKTILKIYTDIKKGWHRKTGKKVGSRIGLRFSVGKGGTNLQEDMYRIAIRLSKLGYLDPKTGDDLAYYYKNNPELNEQPYWREDNIRDINIAIEHYQYYRFSTSKKQDGLINKGARTERELSYDYHKGITKQQRISTLERKYGVSLNRPRVTDWTHHLPLMGSVGKDQQNYTDDVIALYSAFILIGRTTQTKENKAKLKAWRYPGGALSFEETLQTLKCPDEFVTPLIDTLTAYQRDIEENPNSRDRPKEKGVIRPKDETHVHLIEEMTGRSKVKNIQKYTSELNLRSRPSDYENVVHSLVSGVGHAEGYFKITTGVTLDGWFYDLGVEFGFEFRLGIRLEDDGRYRAYGKISLEAGAEAALDLWIIRFGGGADFAYFWEFGGIYDTAWDLGASIWNGKKELARGIAEQISAPELDEFVSKPDAQIPNQITHYNTVGTKQSAHIDVGKRRSKRSKQRPKLKPKSLDWDAEDDDRFNIEFVPLEVTNFTTTFNQSDWGYHGEQVGTTNIRSTRATVSVPGPKGDLEFIFDWSDSKIRNDANPDNDGDYRNLSVTVLGVKNLSDASLKEVNVLVEAFVALFRGITSWPTHEIFKLVTETGRIIAKDPNALIQQNKSESNLTGGFKFEGNMVKDPAGNGDGYYLQYTRVSAIVKYDYKLSISKGVPTWAGKVVYKGSVGLGLETEKSLFEFLGTKTLTYLITVYDGYRAQSPNLSSGENGFTKFIHKRAGEMGALPPIIKDLGKPSSPTRKELETWIPKMTPEESAAVRFYIDECERYQKGERELRAANDYIPPAITNNNAKTVYREDENNIKKSTFTLNEEMAGAFRDLRQGLEAFILEPIFFYNFEHGMIYGSPRIKQAKLQKAGRSKKDKD